MDAHIDINSLMNAFVAFMNDNDLSSYMTMRLATKLIGRNRKEFQANTRFSRRHTDWWESSFYRVENHIPLLLPTNLSHVSHLDLAQHSHSFPERTIETEIISAVKIADETLKECKHDPLVDVVPKDAVERVNMTLEHMKNLHDDLVKYTIDLEYHLQVYRNLKSNWDVTRFKRFVDYCLKQEFLGPEAQSMGEMIMYLLEMHCSNDPAFVIEVITKVCKRFHKCNFVFIDQLPSNLIQFFGKCLKQLSGFKEFFEPWLFTEDLVIQAICEGAPTKIKKLVEWEFPSLMLPFAMTPQAALLVRKAWPRKKDGVEIQSFYSLEYFSIFTLFLAGCVAVAMEKFGFDLLRGGFLFFWRSVPTPHLPFSDMSKCLRHMVVTDPDCSPISEDELDEVLEFLEGLVTHEGEYRHDVYAPRSLQHLCRCVVRRVCATPEKIAILPVADGLKPYLCLDK